MAQPKTQAPAATPEEAALMHVHGQLDAIADLLAATVAAIPGAGDKIGAFVIGRADELKRMPEEQQHSPFYLEGYARVADGVRMALETAKLAQEFVAAKSGGNQH